MRDIWNFLASMPPDPAMGIDLWLGFRQEIIGWLLISVLVTVAAIVGIYSWTSRKLTVRKETDPFLPYTPMRWLLLSVVPGVVITVVYVIRYASLFPQARVPAVGAAVMAGITTALVTYVIAQVAIWMPGITPLKFLYHPRWPWRLFRRRAA